jgi:hypothetical protein
VVPNTVRAAVAEPLDQADEARLRALVPERAELFRRWMPIAIADCPTQGHSHSPACPHPGHGMEAKGVAVRNGGLRV